MSEILSESPVTALAWSVLMVRGLDSETFLQGQLSQDLSAIDANGAWSLLLAPDSVVMATCFVQRVEGGFDLTVASSLAEEAQTRLRRFLLRSKCTINLAVAPRGPFLSLDEQIDASWPGEGEINAQLTPHSFGRHFVNVTISFQKGCFTGQELVGRLDARGSSVPWRFVRVSGPSKDVVDRVLKSKGPQGPQGVTSEHSGSGRLYGLGIAHRTLLGGDIIFEQGVTIEAID
jgi:folate-binding protein YgfZ